MRINVWSGALNIDWKNKIFNNKNRKLGLPILFKTLNKKLRYIDENIRPKNHPKPYLKEGIIPGDTPELLSMLKFAKFI